MLVDIRFAGENGRAFHSGRSDMFIAHRGPYLRRRSEERELTRPLTTRSLPLLRTAPEGGATVGYKHVTPYRG
jgi:hypothetical protein